MSVVSSVILQMSTAENAFDDEEEVRPGVDAITAWLEKYGHAPMVELQEHMPRGKHPQTFVFGGGYNHFPEDSFAEFVMGMTWNAPECVVLMINPECGETRIWRPAY